MYDEEMSDYYYCFADLVCAVQMADGAEPDISLLPAFTPFQVYDVPYAADILLRVTVDDRLSPLQGTISWRHVIDHDNGEILVACSDDNDYQFIFKDQWGRDCALLITNDDFSQCAIALNGTPWMRLFGVNMAMMVAFTFAASKRSTVVLHASAVVCDGYGYAFTAKSGTGKSTHAQLWIDTIAGCSLLNDDNPIVRLIDDKVYLYGSPWSGKTPCYKNERVPLGAIAGVIRAEENRVTAANMLDATVMLLNGTAMLPFHETVHNSIVTTILSIIRLTPIFNLYCLPDVAAAELCHHTIAHPL